MLRLATRMECGTASSPSSIAEVTLHSSRLGLAGTRELFHYGVAGGGSKTENSTRYTLQVRPVHIRESIAYAVEAMGINRPAHDAPAIDETVFDAMVRHRK